MLKKMGIGATLFIPSDWLLKPRLTPYRTMSASQANSVASDGFEIASHGKSHVHLTALGQETLVKEIEGSRVTLSETIHARVDGFAYPFGASNKKVVDSVKSAGYRYACASSIVPLRELLHYNRFLIPRIDVSRRAPEIAYSFVRGHQTIVRGESLRSYSFTLKHRSVGHNQTRIVGPESRR